ncbi:hypothetical protein MRB53_036865 [Persea americana]|nr:hypothetical protein MRB53_036865 [Persea americana]
MPDETQGRRRVMCGGSRIYPLKGARHGRSWLMTLVAGIDHRFQFAVSFINIDTTPSLLHISVAVSKAHSGPHQHVVDNVHDVSWHSRAKQRMGSRATVVSVQFTCIAESLDYARGSGLLTRPVRARAGITGQALSRPLQQLEVNGSQALPLSINTNDIDHDSRLARPSSSHLSLESDHRRYSASCSCAPHHVQSSNFRSTSNYQFQQHPRHPQSPIASRMSYSKTHSILLQTNNAGQFVVGVLATEADTICGMPIRHRNNVEAYIAIFPPTPAAICMGNVRPRKHCSASVHPKCSVFDRQDFSIVRGASARLQGLPQCLTPTYEMLPLSMSHHARSSNPGSALLDQRRSVLAILQKICLSGETCMSAKLHRAPWGDTMCACCTSIAGCRALFTTAIQYFVLLWTWKTMRNMYAHIFQASNGCNPPHSDSSIQHTRLIPQHTYLEPGPVILPPNSRCAARPKCDKKGQKASTTAYLWGSGVTSAPRSINFKITRTVKAQAGPWWSTRAC